MKKFFEILFFHIKRRIPAILACVLLFCTFGLYYFGVFDVSFIKRPEAWANNSTLFYNAMDELFGEKQEEETKPDAPETEPPETDNAESTPDNEQNTPDRVDRPAQSEQDPSAILPYTVMPTVSQLTAEGYKTTDAVFTEGTKFALLETAFPLPHIFSFREKTYDKDEVVHYDDGTPSEVKTTTVTAKRPAIELYMGYILFDDGGTLYLLNSNGTALTKYDDTKYIPAFTRDKEGRPLFYQIVKEEIEYPTELGEPDAEGNRPWLQSAKLKIERKKYFYLDTDGRTFKESDYIDAIHNRGLYFDYPAYYGITTEDDTKEGLVRYYKYTPKVLTRDMKIKNKLQSVTSLVDVVNWLFKKKDDETFDPTSEELVLPYTKAYDYKGGYAVVERQLSWSYTNPDLPPAEAALTEPTEVKWPELQVIDEEGNVMFESRKSFTSDLGWNANEYYTEPLLKDISSIGSYYFDHGLLRIRLVSYDRYQYIKYDMFMVGTDDDILVRSDGTKFYIPAGYKLEAYSDGMLLLSKGRKYGYLDYTGKWVVQPQLIHGGAFVEGVAAIQNESGKWGMIDTKGNAVIPFKYSYVSNISSGLVAAYSDDTGWEIYTKMAK